MKLQLPPQLPDGQKMELDCPCSMVAIGANGSGKSLFGQQLLALNLAHSVRIAALNGIYRAVEKEGVRVTDFDRLVQRVTDNYAIAAIDRLQAGAANAPTDNTVFDRIKKLWNVIFSSHELFFIEGTLHLVPQGNAAPAYPVQRMSDGEKAIFYLIASIFLAPGNAILLIEEPETHLHHSIKLQLWDELERARKDCSFLYITHDLDFTASRANAIRLWIKGYDTTSGMFDYETISHEEALPEAVLLEILGSRKPVLFIEGDDSQSIDRRLYSAIFPNCIVKPLGSCQKVIETTKSFNEQKNFHQLQARGIVDRDRRTPEEIGYLREQHIYVPEVAEVENLLMLEPVVKTVAQHMLKDPNKVFDEVKANVIELFAKEMDAQTLLHAKNSVQKRLERALNLKLRRKEELQQAIDELQGDINVERIYQSLRDEFEQLVATRNYGGILRVFNQKGMLPQSRVVALCGLSNKNSYLQLILDILNDRKEEAQTLYAAIKKALQVEDL